MTWIGITVGLTFVLLGAVCVLLVVIGLPGTWLMLGVALVADLLIAPHLGAGIPFFGWKALAAATVVAIIGEVLEVIAAAEGAKRGGASRQGAVGAIIGGIAGGLAGTIFIPIPIVGSLAGAVIGAVGGAVIGELSRPGVRLRDTAKPAAGAAIGRILGTLSKVPCAAIAWVVLSISAFRT